MFVLNKIERGYEDDDMRDDLYISEKGELEGRA
jgi:hypothetical protein